MPLAHHQLPAGATIRRRIAAGAVVAGLGLAVGLPSGMAQDRPADSQVLTERFPLDAEETAPQAPVAPPASEPAIPPPAQATPPAPAPALEPAAPGGPADDSEDDSMMLVAIIAAAVGLLALGLVGGIALRRRRLRNSEPPIPPRRRSRAPDGRAGAAAMEARFRPRGDDPEIDALNARFSSSEVPPVPQPEIAPTAPSPAPAPSAAEPRPGGDAAHEAPPSRVRQRRLRRRDPVVEPAPAAAAPPRTDPPPATPPAPAPDITLVEAAPGGPTPRPRVHDDDAEPPLPDITLIGGANGDGGRRDALPGLGDDPVEPRPRPSLDELPDITLVEPPPPPPPTPPPPPASSRRRPRRDEGSEALLSRFRVRRRDAGAEALASRIRPSPEGDAPPPPPAPTPPPAEPPRAAPARRVIDPGSAALAARIRPDVAQLDAAARALRSRTPRREESERPEVFWSARERAQTELQAAAEAAGSAPPQPPPPEPEDEPVVSPEPPSLPSAVLEIATPRHTPAAAAVPVAVIHGVRSALKALRSGSREEDPDRD